VAVLAGGAAPTLGCVGGTPPTFGWAGPLGTVFWGTVFCLAFWLGSLGLTCARMTLPEPERVSDARVQYGMASVDKNVAAKSR
jgi:hypothetical protein